MLDIVGASSHGKGIFYWAPEWIPVAGTEDKADAPPTALLHSAMILSRMKAFVFPAMGTAFVTASNSALIMPTPVST